MIDMATVHCLKNSHHLATIEFAGNEVDITIPDVYKVIRSQHIKAFDPIEFGIQVQTAEDWLGEKKPDLVINWALPEEIPGMNLPHHPVPRQPRLRTPRIRRAL